MVINFSTMNCIEYTRLRGICKATKKAVRRRNLEQLSSQDMSYAIIKRTICLQCFNLNSPDMYSKQLTCDHCPYMLCMECDFDKLHEGEEPWFSECRKCKSIVCFFCTDNTIWTDNILWTSNGQMYYDKHQVGDIATCICKQCIIY